MTKIDVSMVGVANIFVGVKRRKLNPKWVVTLAASIQETGLIHPIEVAEDGSGYLLVSGAHRLAAMKQLGMEDVPCIIKTASDLKSDATLKMRELTENLVRNDLSVLDKSFDIADWRDFYTATHSINKGGRPKLTPPSEWEEKLSLDFALSFSEAAQQVLEISRSSVFNYLRVAALGEDIRHQIALHAIADNLSELLLLAGESEARRKDIANMLTAEPPLAASVADAIAILDKVPAATKLERWQAFHSKFAALKEQEQARFFAANRDAIVAWLEASKA